MDSDEFFTTHLTKPPMMAILRNFAPAETARLSRVAWTAGITLVEVPIQTQAAVEALRAARAVADEIEGAVLGAGTVVSTDQLDVARDAGAQFTVAPGLNPEVVHAARRAGIPHLPGVATSTEIDAATRLGLGWLKAFPAAALGAGWITAQLGPFPELHFVATGGIGPDNALAFLRAGASAVAVGSAISSPEIITTLMAELND